MNIMCVKCGEEVDSKLAKGSLKHPYCRECFSKVWGNDYEAYLGSAMNMTRRMGPVYIVTGLGVVSGIFSVVLVIVGIGLLMVEFNGFAKILAVVISWLGSLLTLGLALSCGQFVREERSYR